MPEWIFDDIRRATRDSLETAGVLLVSVVESAGSVRLLAREMHWVPVAAYLERSEDELTISSEGYMQALARAEEINAVAIWFHTHPTISGIPIASGRDEIVDQALAPVFRLRTGGSYYGALIGSPRDSGFTFTGFLQAAEREAIPINFLWVIGDRFRRIHSYGFETRLTPAEFDRNVRAFGGELQSNLASMKIGIVGCGGTGSCVAELLVRLGVRDFVLIDPDVISKSNLTRVFGSFEPDVGTPKVTVTERHLKMISSCANVLAIQSSINVQSTAKQLAGCDLVFGCTDDNAGRLVLSRLSTYMLIPVIDCGVLLSSGENGILEGINGRVTTMSPGSACLVCRNRIDLKRAASELMTPEERVRLETEGYAPALGRVEPAVVTFTSAVASTAVSEMLERFIGYGPSLRPDEVLVRFHEREISTNVAVPRIGHYCSQVAGKIGSGITEPFLDQAWTA
jgi:molybdopterin/thiamine biosynthesis adenylyltransferase